MVTKPLSFLKGLSKSSDHMTVPDGCLLQMDDWQRVYGYLRPRYGQTVVNSANIGSSGEAVSLAFYSDTTANGPIVVAVTNSKIYRATYRTDAIWKVANNVSFTDITGTGVVSNGGYPLISDQLNNVLIMAQRGAPNQITGVAVNAAPLAGSPPSASVVKVCNNFAFLSGTYFAGSTTTMSRVYWSNVADPQTWGAANFVDFRPGDGDFVTALGAVGTNLIIFKNNAVGSLSTQTVSASGSVTLGPLYTNFTGLGCPGPQALDNLPDGNLIFLGTDWNLYLFDGLSITNLTKNTFPDPSIYENALSADTIINGARGLQLPIVKYFPPYSEIWLFIPDNDFNASPNYAKGYIYAFDMRTNAWRRITGMTLASLLVLSQNRFSNSGAVSGVFTTKSHVMLAGTFDLSVQNNVLFMDNDTTTSPNDYAGTAITAKVTFSVADPEIVANSTLRSIDIPSSNSGTTTVWFGFDGTLNGASTATLSSSKIQNVIPIPYQQGTLRRASIQIQLQDTNTANKIYIPYLSDEVIP